MKGHVKAPVRSKFIRIGWGRGRKPNTENYHFKLHTQFKFTLTDTTAKVLRENVLIK